MKSIYIVGHQGLGDHILCNGIYRTMAEQYNLCVLAVNSTYAKSIKEMLKDVKNIKIISYPDIIFEPMALAHRDKLEKKGFQVLSLGYYGNNFFQDKNKRLDENYYHQAGLPIEFRWEKFKYIRDIERENKLFSLLIKSRTPYIFLHQDIKRGFKIKNELLLHNFDTIEPLSHNSKFTVFNYIKILENAEQIHCIESSFTALIESIETKGNLFAHRYARPEAKNDYKHEFTYKKDWQILL